MKFLCGLDVESNVSSIFSSAVKMYYSPFMREFDHAAVPI